MSKHTPGPWTAREPNGSGIGWRVGPAWLGEAPWSDEARADAHLIAAAPDLLAALEDLLPWLEDCRMADGARAAITKARGQ